MAGFEFGSVESEAATLPTVPQRLSEVIKYFLKLGLFLFIFVFPK